MKSFKYGLTVILIIAFFTTLSAPLVAEGTDDKGLPLPPHLSKNKLLCKKNNLLSYDSQCNCRPDEFCKPIPVKRFKDTTTGSSILEDLPETCYLCVPRARVCEELAENAFDNPNECRARCEDQIWRRAVCIETPLDELVSPNTAKLLTPGMTCYVCEGTVFEVETLMQTGDSAKQKDVDCSKWGPGYYPDYGSCNEWCTFMLGNYHCRFQKSLSHRGGCWKCISEEEEYSLEVQSVIPLTGNNPFNPYNPLGGTTTPPPPPSTQCVYTYSDWGQCQSNNTQTRTVISSSPPGCIGTPVLTQSCTSTPPPGCTTPQPSSESQTISCPAGQTGTMSQTRPYSCVGSTWVPGAWQTVSNNCTCDPLVRPQPEGQNIPCPAGQTGTITQQRAYVCSNGAWVPGTNWVEVTRNCTTPQTGCSTLFHTGNYVCGGGCGVSGFNVSFTPGSSTMQLGGFGPNPTSTFSCNGTTATSPSTFILFGVPGHTVVFNAGGGGSVALSGSRPGASCSDSCR